ncbi:hypothetical protein Q604_UNBc4C00023G0012, partial [human gut metagenome]
NLEPILEFLRWGFVLIVRKSIDY